MDSKIIVVGMDNSGKTTLVNQLAEFYNCEHIKSLGPGYTREEMLEEVVRKLELPGRVILERFSILEELVYGKVLRNESKFTLDDMEIVKEYDTVIIYCRPDDKVIYNFGEREQMEGVIEQRFRLVQEWDELIIQLSRRGFVIIPYDWTKNTLENITNITGGKR